MTAPRAQEPLPDDECAACGAPRSEHIRGFQCPLVGSFMPMRAARPTPEPSEAMASTTAAKMCSCYVVTGGHRVANPACEFHREAATPPARVGEASKQVEMGASEKFGEERYWCGCRRLATWDRCERHAGMEHDEEPPTKREEEEASARVGEPCDAMVEAAHEAFQREERRGTGYRARLTAAITAALAAQEGTP